MPYINKEKRDQYELLISGIVDKLKNTDCDPHPGYLNYIVCSILLRAYDIKEKPSYTKFNEIIGILECAKSEIYRRWTSSYEDEKIKSEGDIL